MDAELLLQELAKGSALGPFGALISPLREHDRARGSDLVVMTSHGRRGLTRALLGSQTAEVLARAKVPVLVIR